jgi:hypothetical protein
MSGHNNGKNGFPDPQQHCPPPAAAEWSDSAAIADAFALALDGVTELMRDFTSLDELDEDIAWSTFAHRLQYPAHYRLSKRRMAELLAAAIGMLTQVRAVHAHEMTRQER